MKAFPRVCLHYNFRNCKHGDQCKKLHLCKWFVVYGYCTAPRCRKEHKITQQTLQILRESSVVVSDNLLGEQDQNICRDLFANVSAADDFEAYIKSKQLHKCPCYQLPTLEGVVRGMGKSETGEKLLSGIKNLSISEQSSLKGSSCREGIDSLGRHVDWVEEPPPDQALHMSLPGFEASETPLPTQKAQEMSSSTGAPQSTQGAQSMQPDSGYGSSSLPKSRPMKKEHMLADVVTYLVLRRGWAPWEEFREKFGVDRDWDPPAWLNVTARNDPNRFLAVEKGIWFIKFSYFSGEPGNGPPNTVFLALFYLYFYADSINFSVKPVFIAILSNYLINIDSRYFIIY